MVPSSPNIDETRMSEFDCFQRRSNLEYMIRPVYLPVLRMVSVPPRAPKATEDAL